MSLLLFIDNCNTFQTIISEVRHGSRNTDSKSGYRKGNLAINFSFCPPRTPNFSSEYLGFYLSIDPEIFNTVAKANNGCHYLRIIIRIKDIMHVLCLRTSKVFCFQYREKARYCFYLLAPLMNTHLSKFTSEFGSN